MRARIFLTAMLVSPALAGELPVNDVERGLGIPYVQERVTLDIHEELSFHGDGERSYRNPAYEGDWRRAYCYLVYWRDAVATAKSRGEITIKEMNPIERALHRDQNDVKLENIDAYKKERSLFLRTRAAVKKQGLGACDGR